MTDNDVMKKSIAVVFFMAILVIVGMIALVS